MKKLALVCMLALSACGGDDSTDTKNTTTKCTANQQKCEGNVLQTCNAQGVWLPTDCGTTKTCQAIAGLPNRYECATIVVPKEAGEVCTGSNQGNCADGLGCTNLSVVEIEASICTEACDPTDSAACPGGTCDPMLGWCVTNDGTFGAPCGYNAEGCTTELTCTQYATSTPAMACMQACDWTQINQGAGDCPSLTDSEGTTYQTECMEGAFVDVQVNDAGNAYVECTEEGSNAAPCDGTNGYVCNTVNTGGTSTAQYCTRPTAFCAVPTASTADFSDVGIMLPETQCGLPGLACMPVGTTQAECVSSGYGSVMLESEAECSSNTDCDSGNKCVLLSDNKKHCILGCNSMADCDFASGFECTDTLLGQLCFLPSSYCVSFCNDEGQDCGTGYTCARPTVTCDENDDACLANGNSSLFPFPDMQIANDDWVECEDSNGCDQSAVSASDFYTCIDFEPFFGQAGKYCARPQKVCVAN